MNEKFKKTVVGFAFAFLVCVIVVLSIADNIAIRRADTTIDNLGLELADAQQRLTHSRAEIENMENALDMFYGKYGSDDDNNSFNGGELN